MQIKLYNTLTRKKEIFKPKKRTVSIYVCGPTVYDYAHIGNFRAYIFSDLLRRTLRFNGLRVREVMNLTDVDDKTIKKSQELGISLRELTIKYEKAFLQDFYSLNLEKPEVLCRATKNIKEMIKLIRTLLRKGYAYKAKDGIYFSIKKFKNYGKLSKVKLKKLRPERILSDSYDKKNIQDFALWKFYTKKDGDVFFKADFGKGRPGWHIECSAMSMKHLGKSFDIHTGGIDLVFPHHENEIAQSEAATGYKFVNYWLHNEWVFVNGKKMSKSLGNFYTLRDIIARDYNPLIYKYICLGSHYKQQLNFTWQGLENAKNSYYRLKNLIKLSKEGKKDNYHYYLEKFREAMNNDLDSPKALSILWEAVKDKTFSRKKKLSFVKQADKVLGLDLLRKEKISTPGEISRLMEEREKARKNKEWKKADQIREKIKKLGFTIQDTEKGSRLEKL